MFSGSSRMVMPRGAACAQTSRIDCRKLSRSAATGSTGNGSCGTAGCAAHSSVEAGSQVGRQIDGVLGVLDRVRPLGGIGAGQVALLTGVVVTPGGEHFGHRQPGTLDARAPLAGIHRLRVAGKVDAVVAGLPGRAEHHVGLVEHVVADPRQRVALQRVLERHDAILPDAPGLPTLSLPATFRAGRA